MKVLIVTETIHAGGAETFVLRLARKLNKDGVSAELLTLNPDLEDKELLDQFPDLVIHRVAPPLIRWVKRADRLLKKLRIDFSIQYTFTRKAIERRGLLHYDVYHTHLFPVDLLFSKLKRQHPWMRLVTTLHGDYNDYNLHWQQHDNQKILNWPQKVAFLKTSIDKWVFISKNQLALFEGTYGIKETEMRKIYNGFEPPAAIVEPPVKTGPKGLRFIMVARGIPEKGWKYIIQAFNRIDGPHELLLVGKGPELDVLKERYKDKRRVRFTGFHPNPSQLIMESDIFVFTSIYEAESLPTVVIEALYCGKPVISSRIGEVEEMIHADGHDELAGILVDYKDREEFVEGLSAAINRYINDRALLEQHRVLALSAFKKFDMEQCAQHYIHAYQEVCSRN